MLPLPPNHRGYGRNSINVRDIMTATAKIILDSISPDGIRLTTMQLRYPRMVHADFMTHRLFSRNGRSSRAVPFATLVKEKPYTPFFMLNQPGMVAAEEMTIADRRKAELIWNRAAYECQKAAQELAELKVHKQWVNRMLEWFGYIDVLVTATDWNNFFALRDEAGAQPEIQELARAMKEAMDGSTPTLLDPGLNQWHMPYIDYEADFILIKEELKDVNPEEIDEILLKVSVARCARLTIKPFDGNASIERELERYKLLMESRPVHASPAEHIAIPDTLNPYMADESLVFYNSAGNKVYPCRWNNEHEHGNFVGWRQFRKMIPHNTVW